MDNFLFDFTKYTQQNKTYIFKLIIPKIQTKFQTKFNLNYQPIYSNSNIRYLSYNSDLHSQK